MWVCRIFLQVTIGTAGKATDLITQHVIMVKESDKLDRYVVKSPDI